MKRKTRMESELNPPKPITILKKKGKRVKNSASPKIIPSKVQSVARSSPEASTKWVLPTRVPERVGNIKCVAPITASLPLRDTQAFSPNRLTLP